MKPANSTGKLKYLNAVADYFIEQGYKVAEPKAKNDFLDVWGELKRRTCYQEIYLASQVFETNYGFYAVWTCSDNNAEVDYNVDLDRVHSYDDFEGLLEDLKPFKKVKRRIK